MRKLLHQVRKAHARLAQQVFLGHAHVLEEQLRGVLGLHADFLQALALVEARRIGFHQEQAGALGAGLGVGLGNDDHQIGQVAVGDKSLGAVDHVLIAVQNRCGLDALQVGTSARLGHGNGRDHVPGDQFGQVLVLQRFTAVMQDVRRDNIRMQGKADAGQPQAADLFDHHRAVEKIRAQTAIFLWQVGTQHARLPRLVPQVTVDIALLFPLPMEGHGVLFEEGAHALTEEFVLRAEQGSGDHGSPAWIVGQGRAHRAYAPKASRDTGHMRQKIRRSSRLVTTFPYKNK